jgi:putative tricarboxylic transport membrane protein
MEVFDLLLSGFAISFQPMNVALLIAGCTIGLIVGAMPGLGSINGVALMLPMTFLVPPGSAIIFLAAIYYGAMYGGAISSIMLGIPGASTAVATVFDGRPMALKGEGDVALVTAATASFAGGTVAVILFTLFAPPLAEVALSFGPPEMFALMLAAYATFVGLGGDDIGKTFFSIFIGLVMSAVGVDILSGQPRLIFFELTGFYHGISFLVLSIAVYGIGEVLWTVEVYQKDVKMASAKFSLKGMAIALRKAADTYKAMCVGSILGFFVGVLPAAGATPGSLMSYGVVKSLAKDRETYGKGNINGVAAPEAANNSASTGAMLPMLTLGIPGSPTTALLLGGMMIWGLQPGPMMFVNDKDFVWGLIASLYVANIFSLVLNLSAIPVFIWVLKLPFTILATIIYILCMIGTYAVTESLHDLWLMLALGAGAYLMRKMDYPMAPAVLALVLGPLTERAFRQSLIMSSGSFDIFFTRPISGSIMIVAILLLFLPVINILWKKARNRRQGLSS